MIVFASWVLFYNTTCTFSLLTPIYWADTNIWWRQRKKTDKSKQEQIRTEKHYIGIDSGNGSLKASSDKELSAKASSYIYTPKAETENNILDKEGCSVLYSPGVRADLIGERFLIGSPAYSTSPQGKLEIAQLDKGKVDADIQSSYQNAVSNLRINSNSCHRAKAANRN